MISKSLTSIQGGTGKTGNLDVHFSRQGKHGNFAKKIKYMISHRDFTSNSETILKFKKEDLLEFPSKF